MAKLRKPTKVADGKVVRLGEFIKHLQANWGTVQKYCINTQKTPLTTRVKLVALQEAQVKKYHGQAKEGWMCQVLDHRILSINKLEKKVIAFVRTTNITAQIKGLVSVAVYHEEVPKRPKQQVVKTLALTKKAKQQQGRLPPSVRINLHATPQQASNGTRDVYSSQLLPIPRYLEE